MEGMILHRGAVEVSRDDLDLIEVPQETESYKPVSHRALADSITVIANDMLKGYTLEKEQFAVARQGAQMFGVISYRHPDFETSLSIGMRNSLDKTISIGLCVGLKVFVCDNLSFKGDVTILRKHTLHVWKSLEDLTISTLYRSGKVHEEITADFDGMKQIQLTDEKAYMILGLLYGKEALSPRQLTAALAQWQKPAHEEFNPRNMYSLYNGCTEALKSSAPIDVMDRHIRLHNVITLDKDQWT